MYLIVIATVATDINNYKEVEVDHPYKNYLQQYNTYYNSYISELKTIQPLNLDDW